jgi:subtilisin family serine protease
MLALELVRLTTLMALSSGRPEVQIGLIDGPVVTRHPDLASEHLRERLGGNDGTCTLTNSTACLHGTFVAGVLSAKRGSSAPAICPNCTLLIRPVFIETLSAGEHMPSTTPRELAAAVIECVEAGSRVINLSLAVTVPSSKGEQELEEALNHAVRRGVLVVAAAGNQSTLGSSAITRHPWVISVVACDLQGNPRSDSNLGSSIGRRGLRAPGDGVSSLGTEGQPLTLTGTSVAVPFVTGAIALLCSEFPTASAAQIKVAISQTSIPRRASVVPSFLQNNAVN